MADSKQNDQNNDIPKMADSHTDVDDDAAKILVVMSSSGGTVQNDAEMRTLEHAAAQGAPAPTPSPSQGATSSVTPAPAAITSDNASNIVASFENDESEGQTAHTSNGTIRASRAPTTLVASDARTTSAGAARGIIERVLVTPERTILAGRVDHGLTARQREKLPAAQGGQEVETEQETEHNDPMDIDTQDNVNVSQTESTDTKSQVVVLPATQWFRLQAQAQQGSRNSNTTEEFGGQKPQADKGKGQAPADDQTNNVGTMVQAEERASLRGGALPDDSSPPSHKPSKAPLRAQTTTALHFLQTTANPETAKDLARRAELNNANELARRIGVRPSIRQVGSLPGLDFAIVDLEASINAVRAATHRDNRDRQIAPAQGASSSSVAVAVAAAPARPHTTFHGVYIHTARCDNCDARNQSVLFRCKDCSNQLCRPCMEEDPIHRTDGLDWTDHGAQSASKPRSNPGAPRQRRLKVDMTQPKPKPTGRGPASKVTKTKATAAQNRVRSGVMNLNSPRNSLAGVAAINARARRLQGGADGADDEDDEDDEVEDEDEVEVMGESSRTRAGMGGRNMDMYTMGGDSVLGKRTREQRMFERRHPLTFNPVGASVPYAGPSHFQPPRVSPPSAGRAILRPRSTRPVPSTAQRPQQIKQESDEEGEVLFSVYDRENKAKEAKAEKERAAKRHKGPVRRGARLSQERVSQEDSGTERGTPAPALQGSRRPAIAFRTDGTATIRTSLLARQSFAGQNDPAQARRAPRSASPADISPAVNSWLARTNHLRSDYTRVTNEEAELEEQLARIKAEKTNIEKGFRDLMK